MGILCTGTVRGIDVAAKGNFARAALAWRIGVGYDFPIGSGVIPVPAPISTDRLRTR
jgi:hypothetical protein